jgi:hypothetical protein
MAAGIAIEGVFRRKQAVLPVAVAVGGSVILSDPAGLDAPRILEAIATWGNGSFVCYSVDYLASLLLPDDSRLLADAWAGLRVELAGWALQYQPGRCLWIRRNGTGVQIIDLRRWSPGGLPDLRVSLGLDPGELVDRWKVDTFEQACDLARQQSGDLVDVAAALDSGCERAGLARLWRDGPGRIAGWWLDGNVPKSAIRLYPKRLEPAIFAAYHGGRIEQLAAGNWGDITQADIRSAYPWAMTQLPDLNGARYFYLDAYDPGEPLAVWYCSWDVEAQSFGPFPVRTGEDGTSYPTSGRGWYWSVEVAAARDCFGDRIRVQSGYAVRPANDSRPFAGMANLYESRRIARQRGDVAAANLIKLVMTAAYGRLAQERLPDGSRGRWANIALAGILTAIVRARMLRAMWMWTLQGVVPLAVQTDSITLPGRRELIGIDELGGWSVKHGSDALLLPSGAYHVGGGDAVMDRVSGLPLEYVRHVNWDVIREAWKRYGMSNEDMRAAGLAWHGIRFPFFVGIGQALVEKQGRYRYWLRSEWDLIGSPDQGQIADRVGRTRRYRFRPAPLPDGAKIRTYRPAAGIVARRSHQGRDPVKNVIRANDQPEH